MAYERDYRRDERYRDDRPRADRPNYNDDDRGFFDRAGDEVRSWFGDEDAERRRRSDERLEARDQGYGNRPNRDWSDRSERGQDQGYSDRYGSGRSSEAGQGREPRGQSNYGRQSSGQGARDYGRQTFDRGDADVGRQSYGRTDDRPSGYGAQGGGDRSQAGGYGRSGSAMDDYDRWRSQQIDSLDRDYDEYRRENQSKFDSEFSTWRNRRQDQRQHLERIREHMEVVGSDGETIGKVDKVRGDRVILTKNDDPDGHHHSFSSSWIETVDNDQIKLTKSADEARKQWKDEEKRQPLSGEGGDYGQGARNLDRSFSGTY